MTVLRSFMPPHWSVVSHLVEPPQYGDAIDAPRFMLTISRQPEQICLVSSELRSYMSVRSIGYHTCLDSYAESDIIYAPIPFPPFLSQ